MKFAIVIAITLALAMGVQSSWHPLAHHHVALAAPVHVVSGPHLVHAHHAPASVAIHASAVHPHAHGPVLAVAAPHWHAHAAHAHVAHAHIAHGHEGHYVAQTRGAVHSAPLSGHAASASSINLAPAPGTV